MGQNGGVRCRVAAFGIAYGTTNRERRGSALPVTRTQGPEQQQGEREILGDEIAGRDEKGNSNCSANNDYHISRQRELSLLGDRAACGAVAGAL